MGFFGNLFGNAKLGIQISNQVIKTLLKDKELFIYPVIMALLSFVILVGIFVPFILFGGLSYGFLSLLFILIVYYFITTLMATYFLFGMYIAFTSFVQGKKIGIGQALSQAGAYGSLILKWTLFYTALMTVVKLIESRSRGLIGSLINIAIGIGLFLGTTFAVPIIFHDKIGPIDAVKKSALFIVNNIGKTFSGIIYFDIISFIIKIIGVIFIASAIIMAFVDIAGITIGVAGFTIIGHTSAIAIAAVFIIGIAIYIVGALFNYVTLHIYYLVIYDYVTSGKAPKGMDETLIKSSIKHSTGATGLQAQPPPQPQSKAKKSKGKGSDDGSSTGPTPAGGLFQSGGGDAPDLKDFVK